MDFLNNKKRAKKVYKIIIDLIIIIITINKKSKLDAFLRALSLILIIIIKFEKKRVFIYFKRFLFYLQHRQHKMN